MERTKNDGVCRAFVRYFRKGCQAFFVESFCFAFLLEFSSFFPTMQTMTTPEDVRAYCMDNSKAYRVLVPTMGALHEGHAHLIAEGRKRAGDEGLLIVSLFVNPMQFDREEDLRCYPRCFQEDKAWCEALGVDVLFAPQASSMYAPDTSIEIVEKSLSKQLCGASRPGHFAGVCTIVTKLFSITGAHRALFGKKDYQQLAIIRRMVRDLNLSVCIEGVDTVRAPDGLALSSRNSLLSPEQRADAPRLYQALKAAQSAWLLGEKEATPLLSAVQRIIEASPLEMRVDYISLVDAESLKPIEAVEQKALLALAVFYGEIRLIDNVELLLES